jgi:medium-chain acyl-[acyl-carrier-protein] hydrolase
MAKSSHDKDIWLYRHKPNPKAKLRLFCFSYPGGGAHTYRAWADTFSEDVEICAVQLPGRGSRLQEAPFTRLQPMVEALALVLAPYLDLPFAFFGHSMGALIGFELARWLRSESNRLPLHLSVSGCPAPHLPRNRLPIYDLPEAEFIQQLRRLNGTPTEGAKPIQLPIKTSNSDLTIIRWLPYIFPGPMPD